MLTILHVSDLHLGPHFLPAVGISLVEAAGELDPDIIVASGDFTQRAKRVQYREARAFLDRLPSVPIVVVPGNHDVPLYRVAERVFSPYGLYREYISPELDTVLRHAGAVIVGLNSTSPLRAIVNGRVRPWQLDFCRHAFAAAPPDAVRIVVAHHHFAPAPDYAGSRVMPGARRALDHFTRLGVELVFGGHLHRAYIGNSLDVYPGQQQRHGIIIVQSGTTTSRRGRGRERERNSFNLVRIGPAVIRVTHYMYSDELAGFAPVSRHVFPRPGRAFLEDEGAGEKSAFLAPPVGGRGESARRPPGDH